MARRKILKMSMLELSHYRNSLRKALGRSAAERLDNLVYGPFGKTQLRRMLADYVLSYRGKEPVPETAAAEAAEILKSVEALNAEIRELGCVLYIGICKTVSVRSPPTC